jgi:hypothetical protein
MSFEDLLKESATYASRHPFSLRKDILFGRFTNFSPGSGKKNGTGHVVNKLRLYVEKELEAYRNVSDVCVLNGGYRGDQNCTKIPFEEMLTYKYYMTIDGFVSSWKFAEYLPLGERGKGGEGLACEALSPSTLFCT